MMSGVMVQQEGYGMFVHTTPDMTTEEAIAPIPSTESE